MTLIILRGLTGSGKSTVAGKLLERHSGIVEIGIDSIRNKENATESYCFPEAGRRAKKALDDGVTVIVHDAFDNGRHVDMFLQPTGLSLEEESVFVFRLECTKEEALERNLKKPDLEVKRWQTEQQYEKTVAKLPGEVIISTSEKSADQVVDEIVRQIGLES